MSDDNLFEGFLFALQNKSYNVITYLYDNGDNVISSKKDKIVAIICKKGFPVGPITQYFIETPGMRGPMLINSYYTGNYVLMQEVLKSLPSISSWLLKFICEINDHDGIRIYNNIVPNLVCSNCYQKVSMH